jgi:hypothetical protein
MKSVILFLALAAPAECFSLNTGATRIPMAAIRRSPAFYMNEETPTTEKPIEFKPPPPAAAAPVDRGGFDPTQYSITISIAVAFCVVKALSYFGIMDVSD